MTKQLAKKANGFAIGWIIRLGLITGLVSCASVEELKIFQSPGFVMGCAVGDVTADEAVVWSKTTEAMDVQVQYTPDSVWKTVQESALVRTTKERDFTAHVTLSNLTPKTRYRYRSIVPGNYEGPVCEFVTAPASNDPVPVTFAIGGDTRHSFRPFSIFDSLRLSQPDFFVYLGDTIYADKEKGALELSDYWGKYRENRDEFAQDLLASTSLMVMWDDHEVDNDFTMTHRRLPIGRQAFFDYWPIRLSTQDPYRLYRSFTWGKGVEVFLLDGRQYRNPETSTMLGSEQKQWLLHRLAASTATFKFIMSPVPFSDPREDKWGEYSEERDEILKAIQEKNISGVIFLAGDVHHAAVSRMPHDPSVREFIFGPLAAPMNYTISSREPRFEFFHEASQNYGKVTVHPEGPTPTVRVEWFDTTNTLLHRVDVENGQYFSAEP